MKKIIKMKENHYITLIIKVIKNKEKEYYYKNDDKMKVIVKVIKKKGKEYFIIKIGINMIKIIKGIYDNIASDK